MDTRDLVEAAIQQGKNIQALYDGHLRQLTPVAVGTKRGEPQGLFVQFGGTSKTGAVPGWRCLKLSELTDVASTPGPHHFLEVKGGRRSSCLDRVDVSVSGFEG